MWPSLSSDMVVEVAVAGMSLPAFTAMQSTCTAWRDALLSSNEAIESMWHGFLVASFPRAAVLMRLSSSSTRPAAKLIYHMQLRAERATFQATAPLAPCTSSLDQYVFSVELSCALEEHTGEVARWTGTLDKGPWRSTGAVAELSPVGLVDTFPLEARRLRVYVTRLATMQTIVLCDEAFDIDGGDHCWTSLPAASAPRLSSDWGIDRIAQLATSFVDGEDEDGEPFFDFDRIRLDFDWGYRDLQEEEYSQVPEGADYNSDLTDMQVLRYLEHYAPWHLSSLV